jgi:hypothetical protein
MADWDPADLDEAAAAAVATGFRPTEHREATVLREDVIVVDGLDETVWSSSGLPPVQGEPQDPAGAPAIFSAEPLPTMGPYAGAVARQYKILTRHDPCFEGSFDLRRLEDALNQHAKQGWSVHSMQTTTVDNGHGGIKKELLVLLEREEPRLAGASPTVPPSRRGSPANVPNV